MNFFESFRVALGGLLANKLRSVLTMLGIIIGIAAVIVLISIGRGLEAIVQSEFNAIGSNLIFVFPVTPGTQATSGPPSTRGSQGISNEDAAAVADPFRAPDVALVAPLLGRGGLVSYGREEAQTEISGVTPEYTFVRNFAVAQGSFITQEDLLAESRVAVLGASVVKKLFPEDINPIGETIRVNSVPFRVVGIMEEKGGSGFRDENDVVFIPLTTAQRRLFDTRGPDGRYRVSGLFIQAVSEERMDAAALQITQVMREQHNIQFREQDDFQVITQKEILSAAGQITGAVTIFLGIIAAISLLVGGIGIMNIMLVSVTERTREIGLRKAVGAKRRDILLQFLIESTLLAVVGGIVGILLGALGAEVAERAVDQLTTVVSPDIVLLATGVSAAIGIFFGIYPAYRAAGLNPIDALRYE
ncbi:MAG: ABC transporter permease [Anaerolineae bacterium]